MPDCYCITVMITMIMMINKVEVLQMIRILMIIQISNKLINRIIKGINHG